LAFACLAFAGPAKAETTLEKVQRTGVLLCAAEERPGFAGEQGLALDFCRAVARAVAGPNAKVAFALPESDADFAGLADVMFLSQDDIAEHGLASRIVVGPEVFRDPITLMVPETSAAKVPGDLAGHSICLMIGSPGQRALEDRLSSLRPAIMRQSFSEDIELLDAYNVGRCDAAVAETSTLAAMRETRGINGLRSRILAEPLAVTAILAAVPAGEAEWAEQVFGALRESLRRLP